MPNWCNNTVTLRHDDVSKIEMIMEECKKEEETELFQMLRKRPDDQDDNWYDWNVTNWGTKWDVRPEYYDRIDDNTIQLGFDTAWSPPLALYEYLTSEGYFVKAKFHESGMCFVGDYVDGDTDTFEYDKYLDSLQKLRDYIPEDLFEYANLEDQHIFYMEAQEHANLEDQHIFYMEAQERDSEDEDELSSDVEEVFSVELDEQDRAILNKAFADLEAETEKVLAKKPSKKKPAKKKVSAKKTTKKKVVKKKVAAKKPVKKKVAKKPAKKVAKKKTVKKVKKSKE